MSNVRYLGKSSGQSPTVRTDKAIPPRPVKHEALITPPMRYWGRDDVLSGRVVGDSMCPTLLDNDLVMAVIGLTALPLDIVFFPFEANPALPGVTMSVARYNLQQGRAFLTKDHPRYAKYKPEVEPEEILGVIVEILPRSSRSPSENHFNVQSLRAMFRSLRQKCPPGLGWLSAGTMEKLTYALEVPTSEWLDGRLPSGYFRAFARTPQPHVGIGVRDLLTINPTIQSRVGDLVLQTNDQGESVFGVLRRDRLTDPEPGPFWLGSTDADSDVRFEAKDLRQLATIARVDRTDHIALAAGRTETDRRAQSGGREELL
jgi:hypothetical protein